MVLIKNKFKKLQKRTPPIRLILFWSQSNPSRDSISPSSPWGQRGENAGIKVGRYFPLPSSPAPLTALHPGVQVRGYTQRIWVGLYITLLETLTLDQNVELVIPYSIPDLLLTCFRPDFVRVYRSPWEMFPATKQLLDLHHHLRIFEIHQRAFFKRWIKVK